MSNKTDVMKFEEFIKIAGESFPEALTSAAEERFRAMGPLYEEWNAKINVISRKDMDMLYLHHVLHSLAIAEFLKRRFPAIYLRMCGSPEGEAAAESGRRMKILDLGTGGGFPGIPLAVLFPNCDFTLCDSIGKKIKVVSGISEALALENVRPVNARAETLEGTFDFVVSRAVTSLDNFLPWVKGKYGKGILYLKGGDVMEEISDACRKFWMQPSSFTVYGIRDWLQDPYFDGKVVIFIKDRSFSENNL